MCGIFGQLTLGRPVDLATCYSAVEAMCHRGPDGSGVCVGRLRECRAEYQLNPTRRTLRAWQGRGCDFFLGHRRLAVLDLAPEAAQPMANEDGSVWAVLDGGIHNHEEIRNCLEGCSHRFRTDHSDTEVLVHGYEQWGAAIVDRLRGTFALAILDLRQHGLLLARDRFGEKPLYFAARPGGMMFASELKALIQLPECDRTISASAVIDYLHHGQVPAPRSIYQRVRKLRAAERLLIRLDAPGTAEPETYWTPRYEPVRGRSRAQWAEEFEAELSEAIRLRMASDVPLGVLLSGGLDSTVVTRQMSRLSNAPVQTFSIGSTEAPFDESRHAAQVARRYGTLHHAEMLSPERLVELVPTVARIFDEPFADSSAVLTYAVSRMARERVTVALSGDGGDELLAGYGRYRRHHQIGRLLAPVPQVLVGLVLPPIARMWPEHGRGKSFLGSLLPGAKARYFQAFLDQHLVDLSDGRLLASWDRANWDNLLERAWPGRRMKLIDRLCATDCRFHVPEDLMVKLDRTSMSVSLEARAPLLDHKLFELVGRMPLATRFDGQRGKLPFCGIVERDLGREFVDRPERGFSVPLDTWLRNELRADLDDTILKSDGLVGSLFSRSAVETLIEDHCGGTRDQSARLWKLYMLEKWHDCHGRQAAADPAKHILPARAA